MCDLEIRDWKGWSPGVTALLLLCFVTASAEAWQYRSPGHTGYGHSRSHYGRQHYGRQHYGRHYYGGSHYGHSYSRSYGRGYYGGNRYGGYRYGTPYRSGYRYGYSPYRAYGRSYLSPYAYRFPSYLYSSPRSYGYRPNDTYVRPRSSFSGVDPRYALPAQPQGFPEPARQDGGTMHALGGPGWELLSQGESRLALSAFSSEALRHPNQGGPKVGYALAAARTGDLTTGVWAMRRACRIDPNALHYVTLDSNQRQQVEQLIAQYGSATGAPRDCAFMVAALNYLTGEVKPAQLKIDEAISLGDRSGSAAQLSRLIGQRNTEQISAKPVVPEDLPAP